MTKAVYAYYPGCSAHSTAREYDTSARRVCAALGIQLRELEDWTCCGTSFARTASHLLGLALPARNLALAAAQGASTIVTPCPACFSRLTTAKIALRDPSTRQVLGEVLEREEFVSPAIEPLLKILVEIEDLPVRRPLSGLRVAAYYGCLFVRPRSITDFDDPENPESLDRLAERLGATPVDWGLKAECCGAGLAVPRQDVVERLARRILGVALRAGADCIVTACPMCQSNLDLHQKQISSRYGERIHLPVLYISQLMGLAMGMTPKEMLVDKLITDASTALQKVTGIQTP